MIKVVLDTNVWLSGIFWEREASRIIRLAEGKKIKVIVTKDIVLEVTAILEKENKFQRFLKNRKQKIEDLIRSVLNISTLIKSRSRLSIVKEDPKDNKILEAAVDGKANYLISYDKHLSSLKEFRNVKIIPPEEFLRKKLR